MQEVMDRAAAVRLAVFDVDGVLTDGGLYFDEAGRENKVFHSRDGHGMKMLQRGGIELAVISGRRTEAAAGTLDALSDDRQTFGRCRGFGAHRLFLLTENGFSDDGPLPNFPLWRNRVAQGRAP